MNSQKFNTDLENNLQRLWLEVANKVGDEIAPKQQGVTHGAHHFDGSPERGQFLLTQGVMFTELLPKLMKFIEDYHEAHAHKSVDGLCCGCPEDENTIKTMVADELRAIRNRYDDMERKQDQTELEGKDADYDGHVGW